MFTDILFELSTCKSHKDINPNKASATCTVLLIKVGRYVGSIRHLKFNLILVNVRGT